MKKNKDFEKILCKIFHKEPNEICESEIKIEEKKKFTDGKSGSTVYLINLVSPDTSFDGEFILKIIPESKWDAVPEDRNTNNFFTAIKGKVDEKYFTKSVFSDIIDKKLFSLWYYALGGDTNAKQLTDYKQVIEINKSYTYLSEILLKFFNNSNLVRNLTFSKICFSILDYRLKDNGHIDKFLNNIQINPNSKSFHWNEKKYPNPFYYAKNYKDKFQRCWYAPAHCDMHSGNAIVAINNDNIEMQFIDFGLSDHYFPFFYDHAYLETSEIINCDIPIEEELRLENLLIEILKDNNNNHINHTADEGLVRKIEIINTPILAFIEKHTSTSRDLKKQLKLQKICAGLNFCNKPLSKSQKHVAFLYAAFHLNDYLQKYDPDELRNIENEYSQYGDKTHTQESKKKPEIGVPTISNPEKEYIDKKENPFLPKLFRHLDAENDRSPKGDRGLNTQAKLRDYFEVTKDIDTFLKLLDNHWKRNILLLSNEKLGKSSLLAYLCKEANEKRFIEVFIIYANANYKSIPSAIEIHKELKKGLRETLRGTVAILAVDAIDQNVDILPVLSELMQMQKDYSLFLWGAMNETILPVIHNKYDEIIKHIWEDTEQYHYPNWYIIPNDVSELPIELNNIIESAGLPKESAAYKLLSKKILQLKESKMSLFNIYNIAEEFVNDKIIENRPQIEKKLEGWSAVPENVFRRIYPNNDKGTNKIRRYATWIGVKFPRSNDEEWVGYTNINFSDKESVSKEIEKLKLEAFNRNSNNFLTTFDGMHDFIRTNENKDFKIIIINLLKKWEVAAKDYVGDLKDNRDLMNLLHFNMDPFKDEKVLSLLREQLFQRLNNYPAFIPSYILTIDKSELKEKVDILFNDINGVHDKNQVDFKAILSVILNSKKFTLEEVYKYFKSIRNYFKFSLSYNYVLGLLFSENKQYKESEKVYKRLTELDPKNASYWVGYGSSFYYQKNYPEASDAFKKASELDKENQDYLKNYAIALNNLEKYKESEKVYKHLTELDPKNASYWDGFGNSFHYQKKYPEASDAFKKASELDKENQGYLKNYAIALTNLEKYKECEKVYKRLTELDPQNASYWVSYIGPLIINKKLYKSLKICEDLYAKTPKLLSEFGYNYACVLSLLDKTSDSVEILIEWKQLKGNILEEGTIKWAKKDPDLLNIREKHPNKFAEIFSTE